MRSRIAITAAIEERLESFRRRISRSCHIDLSLRAHRMSAAPFIAHAMLDRSIAVFRRMGFALAEGPDIETEWHALMPSILRPTIPRGTSRHILSAGWAPVAHPHIHVQIARWISAATHSRHRPGAAYRRDEIDAIIRRSFIRSKVFTWMKMSASPI